MYSKRIWLTSLDSPVSLLRFSSLFKCVLPLFVPLYRTLASYPRIVHFASCILTSKVLVRRSSPHLFPFRFARSRSILCSSSVSSTHDLHLYSFLCDFGMEHIRSEYESRNGTFSGFGCLWCLGREFRSTSFLTNDPPDPFMNVCSSSSLTKDESTKLARKLLRSHSKTLPPRRRSNRRKLSNRQRED